jgi:hypothetical protein
MQLPGPLRAMVGLVATAAEEAKNLPDRAIELPMLAVSSAMQMSLRAQQRYARLAARGEEILNRRDTTDDPPSWATFDEPVPVDSLLAEPLLAAGPPASTPDGGAPAVKAPARKAAPRKAAAKRAPVAEAAEKSTARGKTVSRPRHTAPSRFDAVGDEPADQ